MPILTLLVLVAFCFQKRSFFQLFFHIAHYFLNILARLQYYGYTAPFSQTTSAWSQIIIKQAPSFKRLAYQLFKESSIVHREKPQPPPLCLVSRLSTGTFLICSTGPHPLQIHNVKELLELTSVCSFRQALFTIL